MKIYELDTEKIKNVYDEEEEDFNNTEMIIAVEDFKNSQYGFSIYIKYFNDNTFYDYATDEFDEEGLKLYIKNYRKDNTQNFKTKIERYNEERRNKDKKIEQELKGLGGKK